MMMISPLGVPHSPMVSLLLQILKSLLKASSRTKVEVRLKRKGTAGGKGCRD